MYMVHRIQLGSGSIVIFQYKDLCKVAHYTQRFIAHSCQQPVFCHRRVFHILWRSQSVRSITKGHFTEDTNQVYGNSVQKAKLTLQFNSTLTTKCCHNWVENATIQHKLKLTTLKKHLVLCIRPFNVTVNLCALDALYSYSVLDSY